MKNQGKQKRRINLALICCMVIVCATMFTACTLGSNYEVYENTSEVDAFDSVDINVSNCSVEFVLSDNYGVDIKTKVPEGKTMTVSVDNGTLVIQQPSGNIVSGGEDDFDPYIIVKVPGNDYDAFNVNTSNATVNMSLNGIHVNDINVNTSNDKVLLSTDEKSGDLSITANTSNGNIILNDEKLGTETTTGSGSVSVEINTSNADVQVKTGN